MGRLLILPAPRRPAPPEASGPSDEDLDRREASWMSTAELRGEIQKIGEERLLLLRRESIYREELARQEAGAAGGGGQ